MEALKRVSPEEVGIHSQCMIDFIKQVQAEGIELHSLMVLRHGQVCAEAWWKPYDSVTPQTMFSFSKSITSTAIGFAVQEGLVSLDEKLVDLFPEEAPENPSENLKAADVYSLLTMSCGQEKDIYYEMKSFDHWIHDFMHAEFKYKPGTMFQYNSTGTDMLCAIIKKKTGMNVSEYLKPRLFDKIGMTNISAQLLPGDIEMGGGGFRVKTEDMARLGQFYLNRGSWNGEQLLNAEWIDMATSKQISTVNPIFDNHDSNWQHGYGFQFWRCIPEGLYRADGAYGQFAIMDPDRDVVIAITSSSFQPDRLLNIVWEKLLPGITKEKELPASECFDKLQLLTEELQIPGVWNVRNKAHEDEWSGIRYKVLDADVPCFTDLVGGPGKWGECGQKLSALTFEFMRTECRIHIEDADFASDLYAGMDGTYHVSYVRGEKFAASACWEEENVLCLLVRTLKTVSGSRLRITFGQNEISVKRCPLMPQIGEKFGEMDWEKLVLFI